VRFASALDRVKAQWLRRFSDQDFPLRYLGKSKEEDQLDALAKMHAFTIRS
jgi:hypothetical protein